MPLELAPKVYWVGAVDWTIRDFHGYLTEDGSTYNAYLIVDDHITLIDTVKKEFVPEMLARVAEIVDPAKIDYIVSNHVEMDHSGGLPEVISRVQPEKVFCSPMGKAGPEPPLSKRIGPSSRSRPAASCPLGDITWPSWRPPCSTGRTP